MTLPIRSDDTPLTSKTVAVNRLTNQIDSVSTGGAFRLANP